MKIKEKTRISTRKMDIKNFIYIFTILVFKSILLHLDHSRLSSLIT